MAKGNLFLGHARGKVGDVVFSRAYGKQITRARASQVANPRTIRQNTQRCILATIAKAAAALTPIVDHSFANVTYGAESVRHFRKVNMDKLRQSYLADGADGFNMVAKGGGFLAGQYIISDGNLPAFQCIPTDGLNPIFVQGAGRLSESSDVYVSDFKAAYPFLQGGDQLTLVRIEKVSGSFAAGDAVCALTYDRMVFAPNAFDNDQAEIMTAGHINGAFLDLSKTTNRDMLIGIGDASSGALGFERATGGSVVACALILSRLVNGKWQRSTQSFTMLEQDDYADNEAAIDSYGNVAASVAGADEYLNQATEGEVEQGISSPYLLVRIMAGGDMRSEHTIYRGEDLDIGTIDLEPQLKIVANAYGTGSAGIESVQFLDIEGTSTDGDINIESSGTYAARYVEFAPGDDGNFVGTYMVNCGLAMAPTRIHFKLQAPQP